MADRDLKIRILLEAADKLTRPLRDVAAGSHKAADSLKQTRDRLAEITRAQNDLGAFRKLRGDLKATDQALALARTRVGELAKQMAATAEPTAKMTRQFEAAKREAAALKAQHADQSTRLDTLRDRMRAAGMATGGLVRHERDLREASARTTAELEEQQRRLERITERRARFGAARAGFTSVTDKAGGIAAAGTGAIGIAVSTAAPVVAAARGAMSLEEGMAGVAKVTGMSATAIAGMQDRLVSLSTRIPMTAVDLSNIAAAAGAAGVGMDKLGRPLPDQARQLVEFTDAAARMGIAFDMTAEDAGGTMAKWRQAFLLPQAEVERLGDRINALTNKFGGKAADVADITTRIGPLGKVAGLAAPQIAALASSLSSIGIENEIAATGIKNTMLALTKGEAATKSQVKAFGALGLSAEAVAKRMQIDASGTIVDVMERIGKVRVDKQAALLDNLFGSESISAIAPLLTNLDGLKQRLGLVGTQSQFAGSMTGEFLSRINTTTGATDLAVNGLQAVNLTLGQALLPTIKAGAQRFATFAARSREWAREHPLLAKGVMYLAAGLAVLFAVFGVGAIALAGLLGPIAIVNAGLIAMGVSGGLASIGLLPIIGTILAVAGGIALLVAGVSLIYRHWSGISGFFSGLWGGVRAIFSMSLLDLGKSVLGFVGFALGSLVRFGGAAFAWLTGTFPGLLAKGWAMAWAGFKAALYAAFVTLPAMFFDFGTMIVAGLWKGIKSAPGRLYAGGKALAGSLASGFRAGAGIHSPSRLFMALGGHIISGLDLGLGGGERGLVDRMGRLSATMGAALALSATPALASGAEVKVRRYDRITTSSRAAGPGRASAGSAGAAPAQAVYPITINAAPGMDPQAIAQAVTRELDRRERERASRTRSSFGDDPDTDALL